MGPMDDPTQASNDDTTSPSDESPAPEGVRRRTVVIGVVIAVVLGAMIAIGLRRDDLPIREVRLDGTEMAPEIEGRDLKTGRTISLADFRGKPVILNAWASWCLPCREEAPHFVEITKRHPDIQMLGLNMNNARDDALKFLGESGWTYPSLVDPDAAIGLTKLGIGNLPTTIYIDASGVIRGRSPGEVTLQELESVAGRLKQP